MFACDSTRYNNSNNKNTKRYISSSLRQCFCPNSFRVRRRGDSAQSKNRGPRLSSPLLFTSLHFSSLLCRKRSLRDQTEIRTKHYKLVSSGLGSVSSVVCLCCCPVSPSFSPSLFFDLVVYRFLSTYAFLSVPFFSHATHIFPLLNNETVHYADISLGYPM